MTDQPTQPTPLDKILKLLKDTWQRLLALYHPDNLKKQGLGRSIGLIALTGFILIFLLGLWWNREPNLFDVQAAAQKRAERHEENLVTGYITVNTLIELANRLLNKSGGYLSNDIIPPSVFMDDMPNWEFGVLQQIRDFSKSLRNDISQSGIQSIEDPDLAKAEPKFNVDNKSWFWPASEDQYQEGINLTENYLIRLAAPNNNTAQFFARADNLREWLKNVGKRLGKLSQRLSASVGSQRLGSTATSNTPESNSQPQESTLKTPWTQIDDVFYQARGTCYALIHLLRAVEIDFKTVLAKRNALPILQQIIRELEATQKTVWSPMILNGSEFGLFANHSLVLSSYISRANTGIMELYNLLEGG